MAATFADEFPGFGREAIRRRIMPVGEQPSGRVRGELTQLHTLAPGADGHVGVACSHQESGVHIGPVGDRLELFQPFDVIQDDQCPLAGELRADRGAGVPRDRLEASSSREDSSQAPGHRADVGGTPHTDPEQAVRKDRRAAVDRANAAARTDLPMPPMPWSTTKAADPLIVTGFSRSIKRASAI